MGGVYGRKDRTARLLKLQLLLHQNPRGLDIEEIARKCSVSRRTAYRDLEALESELGVPVWEERNKRGIAEGYFLPPITFTVVEAMNIFLAARLVQNFSFQYSPNMASTFMKLNAIIQPPLKQQIQNTIDYMEKLPLDEQKTSNFNRLTQAWLSQRRVKIQYQALADTGPRERIIEPYFIEPSFSGHSSYVIAYSQPDKKIETFKIDCITSNVAIQPETYQIPADFNAIDYLSSAWGPHADGEPENVRLHFNPKMCQVITATRWHSSQQAEIQEDGSVIMKFKVHITPDFVIWVMGWGSTVKVLEPQTLKDHVARIARAMVKLYGQ
ncbi:MAG: transcriptional regulator [Dehalococcoidales bacterium]|nr:transcriptional regulator [Dehalococcoidales bacterium]